MKKFISLLVCTMYAFAALGLFGALGSAQAATGSRYSLDILPTGGSYAGVQYRTVNYSSFTETKYVNPYSVPVFISSLPASCAVESGGNAIGYFTRLYDDLIPGYAPKYVWGGFTYGSQNAAVTNMFASLFNLMGTTSAGTTVQGFKNGMTSYVNGKGHSIQITSATGNYNNTNIEFIKSQLEQEKLAVVFLDTFSITSFSGFNRYQGYDYISHSIYTGCHTMLVYGYSEVYYYNASGALITRDTYFIVATGFSGTTLGLLNIRDFCQIDDAYIINIL